jgi:hypothetical protein
VISDERWIVASNARRIARLVLEAQTRAEDGGFTRVETFQAPTPGLPKEAVLMGKINKMAADLAAAKVRLSRNPMPDRPC